nr:YgjV family protein [Cellulomonas triticagri]
MVALPKPGTRRAGTVTVMPVLEIIGWVGSALVVVSLMQARVLRFRWMNLAGSAIAAAYNAWVGIWPFAVMNGVIAIIDVYWLVRLYREQHDADVYQVVPVGAGDHYLRHVVGVHADDIARYYPSYARDARDAAAEDAPPATRWAFLVLRGDETVGVVVLRHTGGGVGEVELDYVTPRFRDFAPGEFVYRRSGALVATGLNALVVAADARENDDYLARVGFRHEDGRWRREVAAA